MPRIAPFKLVTVDDILYWQEIKKGGGGGDNYIIYDFPIWVQFVRDSA
jgi:hypothetical protein